MDAYKEALESMFSATRNLRRELTGAADSYAADILEFSLRKEHTEQHVRNKAWDLFWAIPTLRGYGWRDNAGPMIRLANAMEPLFGEVQWHYVEKTNNVAQKKVRDELRADDTPQGVEDVEELELEGEVEPLVHDEVEDFLINLAETVCGHMFSGTDFPEEHRIVSLGGVKWGDITFDVVRGEPGTIGLIHTPDDEWVSVRWDRLPFDDPEYGTFTVQHALRRYKKDGVREVCFTPEGHTRAYA